MLHLLNKICTPGNKIPLSKALLHTFLLTIAAEFLGIIAKLLDIYAHNVGSIFSQMSVWIFLCTAIAVYGSTPLRSAANVLLFCIGMLSSYYLTAE